MCYKCKITKKGNSLNNSKLQNQPKQLRALLILKKQSILISNLHKYKISTYVLNILLRKKLCYIHQSLIKKKNWKHLILTKNIYYKLTNNNILKLKPIVQNNTKFKSFVIKINTIYDKEEVYIFLLFEYLKKGLKTLILVPNIDYIYNLSKFLQKRLQIPIDIYHTHITETKKLILWNKCKTEEAAIIISTSEGIFLPIINLGIIIVNEESNLSYKITKKWTFNTKNLAIMRSYKENIPIILEGNELSLETLHNINIKKFNLITINSKYESFFVKKINQTLIDINHKQCKGIFSIELIEKVQKYLLNNQQVCFVTDNISNAITVLQCSNCNVIMKCQYCHQYYEYSKHYQELSCKYCFFKKNEPFFCTICNSSNYILIKYNVSLLKDSIKKIFFDFPIIHITNDSTMFLNKHLINKFQLKHNNPCIILGNNDTLTKYKLDKIKCLIFLNIDVYFRSNNFRSPEYFGQKYYSTLRKVSNFYTINTEVLIQSKMFKNALIQKLITSNYEKFSSTLLKIRRKYDLPPYTRHIIITIKSKKYEFLTMFFKKYYKFLITYSLNYKNNLWVVKSDIIYFNKYFSTFYTTILLVHPSVIFLKKLSKQSIIFINTKLFFKHIQLTFDMDPI
ncbi:replication restart helicase PriA [Buchnera aphidicola]|uniref:replication restart helicase PriA n=1 Tax=Buchnera aphidicola TaxID=9 RepID=UPI00130EBF80|nr:primosomal protein N' [Buchnera aphidicola]